MNSTYEGNIIFDWKVKNRMSETHIAVFVGEAVEDITLFVTKACTPDSHTLVVDFSSSRKLFLCAVGSIESQSEVKRRICYTYNREYYDTCKNKFDNVFIYSDTTDSIPDLWEDADYAYLSFGLQKYSIHLLEKMISAINKDGRNVPYSLICRGSEKKAEQQCVKDILQVLCIKRNKHDCIYYVPSDEKDINSLIRYEYGVFNVAELSLPMYNAVLSVRERIRRMAGRTLSGCLNGSSSANWLM